MSARVPFDADGALRAVVAIPAKNEEERLAACLTALARQRDVHGRPMPDEALGVLLLLNNCTDGSAALARSLADRFPIPLRIVERDLPADAAHAGGARRIAMDLAAGWLEKSRHGQLLLTTDADSVVNSTWIADNLAAIEGGADAVAGGLMLDREEETALPELLRQRGRLEAIYASQLIEIGALLDPRAHNPWPHHATASGASLAVTLEAYRRIGGLPILPLGEDRAFIAALEAQDARVRYAPNIRVVTSGRLHGRAKGGVADTIRERCENPQAWCDETLEPVRTATARARWRGRLRRLHAEAGLSNIRHWAPSLGLRLDEAIGPRGVASFGAAWIHIERTSPMLRRRRLRPFDLPAQIRLASSTLVRLRQQRASFDDVEAIAPSPPLPP